MTPSTRTEEDALDKCLSIWQFLAETGVRAKGEAYNALNLRYDLHSCPCCEYSDRDNTGHQDCSRCPLWEQKKSGDHLMCTYEGSPYADWETALNTADRKHHAQRMVAAIERCIHMGEKL